MIYNNPSELSSYNMYKIPDVPKNLSPKENFKETKYYSKSDQKRYYTSAYEELL